MRAYIAAAAILASCTFPTVTFDDASVPADAGNDVQPAGDAGSDVVVDPCDEDNDGYKSVACDGGDCNDHDPRAHPGQTQFITDIPDAAPWGDWNCDTKIEKLHTTWIACTAGLTCNTAEGYTADEGCGVTAQYYLCSNLCSLADAGTQVQGCR